MVRVRARVRVRVGVRVRVRAGVRVRARAGVRVVVGVRVGVRVSVRVRLRVRFRFRVRGHSGLAACSVGRYTRQRRLGIVVSTPLVPRENALHHDTLGAGQV